jgi:hypothetical protein
MLNTSYSLIQYQIVENDTILCSGTFPYDLLSHARILTETGSVERKIKVNIDGDYFVISSIGWEIDKTHRHLREATELYELLQTNRIIIEETAKHEAFMKLAEDQLNIDMQIHATAELQRLAIEAFNNYEQILIEQKQLTEEQAQLNEAEKLRQDENRIALVRGIALDPTTAAAALASEFGESGDIRRQVAAVMERDISISKQIVQLPRSVWMSSYEIMEVIGAQSSEDHEFAQLVSDNLPDDSSLKILLKSFGWAN